MKPQTDTVESAILNQIQHHETELKKLKQALLVVTSPVRARVESDEFAAGGIIAGATKLLSNGGELTTRQIADRLLAGGIQTRSRKFVAAVHSTLRNSPKKFSHRHVSDRQLAWTLVPAKKEE